jgi:hypothetical protein
MQATGQGERRTMALADLAGAEDLGLAAGMPQITQFVTCNQQV